MMDFKNFIRESVSIETNRYERSHGKKPRFSGEGSWMFTTAEYGKPDKGDVYTSSYGTYADAKISAKKWAKSKNANKIYVME